jgi:HSP20 family protein
MGGVKDEFEKLSEQLGDMVDEMLSRNFFRYAKPDTWHPAINVYELATAFLVCVDLAGMKRDQIDVQVEGQVLHIRGHRPKPVPEAEDMLCVHAMEIDSGRFSRKLQIPVAIDSKNVRANYSDGYLWITLPRSKPIETGRPGAGRAGDL